MDSNRKGAIAEAAIALEATKLGIDVLRPCVEQRSYDLAFDLGSRIMRVQCKWAAYTGDCVRIAIRRSYYSPTRGYVRGSYGPENVDAIAAYCSELDVCYLIPISLVSGQGMLHLRLVAPKNGQRAAINWAADYELGAVAQLEERVAGSDEAVGSSPTSSTPETVAPETVGAHDFRNRFGWYMERASRGEEFLITRRGRSFARLSPPAELPALRHVPRATS